ncbi:PKD domain-containing protein [Mongoliitalea daihaiensis]|uniref:PKD domain-containing protein n=1 Tax=Mongoliitalea daihaiensis TaxID=2782006 RepID=UPI001F2D69A7|nr:PKD domain-containing protein [Mongoliitalea daihaiensis]UJP64437.1 PKD domain-containing protein [Mongoliitalea daihaiensis]
MKWNIQHIASVFMWLTTWLYAQPILAQNCGQNNVTVAGFEVTDLNGNPFSSTSPFELGEEVNARLFITINASNSENAFSTAIFYDIFIGETKINEGGRLRDCLANNTPLPFGTSVFVREITFTWGETLSIRNILIRWITNSNSACSTITETGNNAQCFSSPQGFEVPLPVIPIIDFSAAACDRTVSFVSESRGGIGQYTYLWDFGDGTTSTEANPVHTFPAVSTYTVSLRVTDAIGGTNIIVRDITIPTITINIEVIPTKLGQNTGSITVTASGGTGPYTVTWSSAEGFNGTHSGFDPSYTIENLGNGSYEIFVTDSQGCSNSVSEVVDWSLILSYAIENFQGLYNPTTQSVKLSWHTEQEFLPGTFTVQRASNAALQFETIHEFQSNGFTQTATQYTFVDTRLPFVQGHIYYRIKYQDSPNKAMFSTVISTQIANATQISQGWMAFPNPVKGEALILRSMGRKNSEPLLINLISTRGEHVQLSIQDPGIEVNLAPHIESFPKGLLIIQILQNDHQETIKVWKN